MNFDHSLLGVGALIHTGLVFLHPEKL